MRINYVLVDYENVKAVDLQKLDRDDVRVIIFLGSHQLKLPSDLVIQMQALGERGEYVQICGSGPNALDFHIAFTIGEKSASQPILFFHIVSKDSGFDPLITYLKGKKILTVRSKSIAELPFLKVTLPKSVSDRTNVVMERLTTPKATKPRSMKTLTNAVKSLFIGQLSEKEVDAVVSALFLNGFARLKDDNISYRDEVSGAVSSPTAIVKKKA